MISILDQKFNFEIEFILVKDLIKIKYHIIRNIIRFKFNYICIQKCLLRKNNRCCNLMPRRLI